jgi:Ser/Thr protein kinase RdoA (MazF antagonist)
VVVDSGQIFGVRSLREPSVKVTTAEAREFALKHWGIAGSATALPAEVDENFRLVSPAGEFLLKLVPADEPAELTDFVTEALLQVERRGEGVAAQRVLSTTAGELHAEFRDATGDRRLARMSTFAPGDVLRSVSIDRPLRERLGSTLAQLALALRDFDHPAADRDLSWDLRHAGRMAAMLDQLPETDRRRELRASLAAFDEEVVPRLTQLPAQVVHNDLSTDNVVLTPTGELVVIDFGDIVRTQRVNDVAVAMVDLLGDGPEPLVPALDLLRGYLAVEPLRADELDLIYDLVRTRVVTRNVGAEWRASRFPENRAYLARNLERVTALLRRLPARPSAADAARLERVAAEAGR